MTIIYKSRLWYYLLYETKRGYYRQNYPGSYRHRIVLCGDEMADGQRLKDNVVGNRRTDAGHLSHRILRDIQTVRHFNIKGTPDF